MADTISRMFLEKARTQPDVVAQFSKDKDGKYQPTTYGQLLSEIKIVAAGILELGVRRGDKVGLIADNRAEWLVTDLALLGLGAADVPRGCDATEQEIRYILSWSECRLAFLENDRQLKKVVASRSAIASLSTVVMFEAPEAGTKAEAEKAGLRVLGYSEVSAM
ncbi:MAG: AMP-binding protein, partial [Spirochaetota bacterium]